MASLRLEREGDQRLQHREAGIDEALDRWRAPALLAGLLALVTLVLTMGGLYAVLTMVVGQRTRRVGLHQPQHPDPFLSWRFGWPSAPARLRCDGYSFTHTGR